MSAWLFDLGNSRLKCAPLHDDGRVGISIAIDHDSHDFPAAWTDALPPRIGTAYVASVAPEALRVQLLDALTRHSPRIMRAHTVPELAGVRIAYAQPHRFGVDRFLALLAARARGAGPWLVVGVGTALTIDLLDADGRHRGGRIAPSPALMRDALQRRAPQLPERGGAYAEFADDTETALASGCVGAALALIERSR
ncbi:MAG: type III pantothenate kinase, partial [Gammaproteobacteria bacterium]|nr:type III pantothenate kinase [Gammaproteobacteria bacterium]